MVSNGVGGSTTLAGKSLCTLSMLKVLREPCQPTNERLLAPVVQWYFDTICAILPDRLEKLTPSDID